MDKKGQFKGKIVLITGAAKNLGQATALAFSQVGATLVVNYRQTKPTFKAGLVIKTDVTDEADVKKLFSQIKEKYGRVDIVVNNVGDFLYKTLDKTSGKEFLEVINNNMISSHLISQEAIKLMRRGGNIVNIAGVGADQMITPTNTTPYYISKTGVLMLTRVLAKQYAAKGIRVNCVSPGILESSIVKNRKTPSGRYARFEDVVRAIMWLAEPASEYITGANIEVSGGWSPV